MNEIVYLIDQAERHFEQKNYEIGASYNLDAWITLKEFLIENEIRKTNEIEFTSLKDTEFVQTWVNQFHIMANEEFQFQTNLEILSSMLEYFEFTNDELIIKQRALCDTYYYLNDIKHCDELYESYIEKNPAIMEYYYGYALTLYDREEYSFAIEKLEEGLSKTSETDNQFVYLALEVIAGIYEELDQSENVSKTKDRLAKLKELA